MPPNVVDPSVQNDPENEIGGRKETVAPPSAQSPAEGYELKLFQSCLNLLAHILIGATVFVTLFFSFSNGLPIGATPTHIVLCVLGVSLYFFCHYFILLQLNIIYISRSQVIV